MPFHKVDTLLQHFAQSGVVNYTQVSFMKNHFNILETKLKHCEDKSPPILQS